MKYDNICASERYHPFELQKIQNELALDVKEAGGASKHARYLENLFVNSGLDVEVPCRKSGKTLAIQMYDWQKLRKIFDMNPANLAKLSDQVLRYLDVLRTLLRLEFHQFTSSAILEEFGYRDIEPDSGSGIPQIPEGRYILEPSSSDHAFALLDMQQSGRSLSRCALWVATDNSIDDYSVSHFSKVGMPPERTFDLWYARGYEVGLDALIKTPTYMRPPFGALVLRNAHDLTPGALIYKIRSNENNERELEIRTPLMFAQYKLILAEEIVDA